MCAKIKLTCSSKQDLRRKKKPHAQSRDGPACKWYFRDCSCGGREHKATQVSGKEKELYGKPEKIVENGIQKRRAVLDML
ncbi:MAG: hypothetical protein NTY51_01330 [Deltaproteobacteria bacterium]|nr:hypothetical protein [Deltaproteobacteria bacterium]